MYFFIIILRTFINQYKVEVQSIQKILIYKFQKFSISKNMPKNSPIKLKSSSKAKLKVTKSPSSHHDQSQSLCDDSKLITSVHTIPAKENPHVPKNLKSNFKPQNINYVKTQPYNNISMRSGSPVGKQVVHHPLQCSKHMSGSKSFHQLVTSQPPPSQQILVSPQKSILCNSTIQQQSIVRIMSPTKSGLDNDRSFMKVDLGKKVIGNQIVTRQRVISPQKIIQTIHTPVSPKQIELQRKVKILQMRIGELYAQKSQMEIQMNESNIRLQYENNILRQKLNSLNTQSTNQAPNNQCNGNTPTVRPTFLKLTSIQKRQSSKQKNEDKSNDKSNVLTHQASQRLIKQLQKSQQNEYHQSKQIHSLKQQLIETQEMLSKQINKSLQLLQELTIKEKQNQDLKDQMKLLRQSLCKLEKQHKETESHSQQVQQWKEMLSKLNQRIQSLQDQKINFTIQVQRLKLTLQSAQSQNHLLSNQLEQLKQQQNELNVTRDLMNQLQSNNQLLITAIRNLQSALKQSEKQVQSLSTHKLELQTKIFELQQEMSCQIKIWEQKDFNHQKQVQTLTSQLHDIQTQLHQKISQIDSLTLSIQEKQTCIRNKENQLQEKQQHIKSQQMKIQNLQKSHQQQANSSTANSFYKKSSNDPCMKCDELRKTIIKLNSHLTRSNSFIQAPNKSC